MTLWKALAKEPIFLPLYPACRLRRVTSLRDNKTDLELVFNSGKCHRSRLIRLEPGFPWLVNGVQMVGTGEMNRNSMEYSWEEVDMHCIAISKGSAFQATFPPESDSKHSVRGIGEW